VEYAIALYVNDHFIMTLRRTYAKAVGTSGTLDMMLEACRQVCTSMVSVKQDVRWINWFHLYQLLEGLWWEDGVGNRIGPANFVYDFLKNRKWKLPDITRTDITRMDI
jgi:hypothetical protein